MIEFENIVEAGRKNLNQSSIIVCGIVRDCAHSLKKNMRIVDALCDMAKEYHVVIFENDSVDDTKGILLEWQRRRKNIYVSLNDFHTETIPAQSKTSNRFFSAHRIEKMAGYRNFYLEYIASQHMVSDYVLIVDLDVKRISLTGFLYSLGENRAWDCIAANGYIYSPSAFFRKRYNDAYALVECGKETLRQTEKTIRQNQYRWAFLKPGMPFIRVFSAFGGQAIYKYAAIKDCRYSVIQNNDERVAVRCEHFSLHSQMTHKGFDKVYIHPCMTVKYQPYIFQRIKKINKNNHAMQFVRNFAGMLYSRIKLLMHRLSNTNRYRLTSKMKKYLGSKECQLPDKDRTAMTGFLSRNLITQISYPFVKKYHYRKVKPAYDAENAMYYVLHHGKRLYFKRSWNKRKICRMYNELCAEQDLASPHSYWKFPVQYLPDDVAVDAGAAEGIWALDVVEKIKTLYVFECDEEWIEALKVTFSPWKEKVTIVSARIADNSNRFGDTSLDDFFPDENISPTIIKADIEGNEILMLKGAPVMFSKYIREAILCAYHNTEDCEILSEMMKQFGFKTEHSEGYMFSIYSEPNFCCKDVSKIIRRGLVRGLK
jgi:hypothetical protein